MLRAVLPEWKCKRAILADNKNKKYFGGVCRNSYAEGKVSPLSNRGFYGFADTNPC